MASSLSIGIVGLPNAGKSTLFNALLKKQQALAANYPFATIEPNVGIVPVPDKRLEVLAAIVEQEEGKRPPVAPATVTFVDIAGLVQGASKGEGLGNQFLSHIREVDAICHVTRYFDDSDVIHVAGEVNPERDRAIIETELILADLQTLAKQTPPKHSNDKRLLRKWELVQLLQKTLNEGKPARSLEFDEEDTRIIQDLRLLTMKPVIHVMNVGEHQRLESSDGIAISAKIEAELSVLSEEEQREYLASLGWQESGLDRLIQTAYKILGLISFLTCGVIEARAWTIRNGTKAPQAAGVIHSDFEKKFIKADVISFDEFSSIGGWKKAREAGKVKMEGKEYVMRDGDVVEFKIGQ
ncbi:MAG: redox-regulated ATPase YchF [Patescibacteria group bacterium]|nr:redox-regulated ATPase YchF [Patescibacteria group bacterium]